MGGGVRKEGTVLADGEPSHVLVRRAERDAAESWSVVVRPYRPKANEELLQDVGSNNTCLLAGNRVAMADGSHLAIERVREGDSVLTMSGPARVRHAETTRLGMTRKVIELRGHDDECLILSDDHPLWVSRRSAEGTVRESWGTYNLNHVLFEMRNRTGYELIDTPAALSFDLPEQVAHISGWLHVRPIYHHMDPDTPLHHLVVDDAFSFIAEGFAVFSHCASAQGPTSPWRGLSPGEAASRFVERVTAAT